MRLISLMFIALMLFGAGCNRGSAVSQQQGRIMVSAPREVAKIKVEQDGVIYLNKKPVNIEELKQELTRLKANNGGVWYWLEDPSNPQAKMVERAILDANVPIKISQEKFE